MTTKFNPLAKKGFDKIGMSEAEVSAAHLKLDQTTPQTVTGGIPLLTGLTPTTDYQIATKKYVDDLSWAAGGGASSFFDLTDAPADPGADKYLMWDDDPGELVWADAGGGGGGAITVQEIDGSPLVTPVDTIKVSNGALTDNEDGSVSIATNLGNITFYKADTSQVNIVLANGKVKFYKADTTEADISLVA